MKFILLCSLLLIIGCEDNMVTTSHETVIDQNELGILPKLMSLPRQPISVKWHLDESETKGTGNLLALLEYNDSDKQYILENSDAFEQQVNDRLPLDIFDHWLPVRAKEQIEVKKVDEMYELQGVIGLKSNLFTQTDLSPYVNGSITPLSQGFILVTLYAM